MFRILSLDGGVIKRAFWAAVLEHDIGKAAADYFDLITGTSTGGIVALEVGLEKRLRELSSSIARMGWRSFRGPASLSGRPVCGGGCGG
jgi:patatin-like phospholipase/acyl hydrolase